MSPPCHFYINHRSYPKLAYGSIHVTDGFGQSLRVPKEQFCYNKLVICTSLLLDSILLRDSCKIFQLKSKFHFVTCNPSLKTFRESFFVSLQQFTDLFLNLMPEKQSHVPRASKQGIKSKAEQKSAAKQ